MSGVVLRCPNCGTTQSSQGECEACHEGQVRFYCTNHKPGRWLDGQACPQCGAVYGRPDPRPASRATPQGRRPLRRLRPEGARQKSVLRQGHPAHGTGQALGEEVHPLGPTRAIMSATKIVARAKALERLHDLLRGGICAAEKSVDMGMPSYPAAPAIAGGCLRILLLIFLFLLLSFFGLSMLGNWIVFF